MLKQCTTQAIYYSYHSPSQTFNVAATIAVTVATAGLTSGIAASGALGNTSAIIFGSMVGSGTNYVTSGGKSDLTVSFGAASFNFSNNELGYLGKDGNSTWQNVGYGLGAFANAGDVVNVVDGYTNWEDKMAAKSKAYMDEWTQQYPNAVVDPTTVGKNFGRSYPSYFGKNPKYYSNGKSFDYMGMVDNWSWREYAGYLHDAEYIKMGIQSGAKYLLASNRTWGADLRLLSRTLYLGAKHNSILEISIGSGLGILNTAKISYGWFVR